MRMTLMIALISVHIFSNTELGQLFKLPKLISHYFEHRKLNSAVTFIEFLAMHYGGDDGTTTDDDTDSQLPYHQVNYHCLFGTYYPLAQYVFSPKLVEYIPEYNSQIILVNSSKHVSLILQPPRTI